MKIALVSYEDQGKYASSVENEDHQLLHFLQAKGLPVELVVWTDPTIDWRRYSTAILKSPWDYFDKIQQFKSWLDHLERLQVRMLNPYPIVRWNCDKHYLGDIAQAGLAVTPTRFLEQGETPELLPFFKELAAQKLIIKPCYSGGAKHTYAFTEAEAAAYAELLQSLLLEEPFMVQPFLPEIQTQGEWSLVFFNGKFSHCLLKKAKPGDFRVQHYLGGSIQALPPPRHLLAAATEYVTQFAKDCLYARVDGVKINNQFVLMELELIEPFLFLFTHRESYQHYYQALTEML